MSNLTSFTPDWVSPPGDTIATILAMRGITDHQFAISIERSMSEAQELIQGRAPITEDIAQKLANVLGATEAFWKKRELRYRQNLDNLLRESSKPNSLEWLSEVPAKELIKLGWMKPGDDDSEVVASCLQFFGVSSVRAWRETYKAQLDAVAFRTSKTFASDQSAVTAWFRQGEIKASEIKCEIWDREKFRENLVGVRKLTRVEDPKEFVPELVRQCAACGVAVVVLRAPKMCKASGASFFLSPHRPLILLSGRHLSDDHFWFTFFHEAGHLVLHSENYISVDGLEDSEDSSNKEEDEANDFAANILIPPEFQEEMLKLTANKIAVMRFARKVGISRGIVVGQLQHRGIIKRKQLNDLKQRYAWE